MSPRKPQEPLDAFSGVLLSHGLHRSTIGAGGLNYRVRNGIGWTPSAITTERIHRLSVDGFMPLSNEPKGAFAP